MSRLPEEHPGIESCDLTFYSIKKALHLLTPLYLGLLLKITFIKFEPTDHIGPLQKNSLSQASPVLTAGVLSHIHISAGAVSLTAGSAMQMQYVVHFTGCCHGY